MTIHIATIRHDHGTNGYADATREGLLRQVADYCRDCWPELGREDDPPTDHLATVTEYFAEHPQETCDIAEAEFQLPAIARDDQPEETP